MIAIYTIYIILSIICYFTQSIQSQSQSLLYNNITTYQFTFIDTTRIPDISNIYYNNHDNNDNDVITIQQQQATLEYKLLYGRQIIVDVYYNINQTQQQQQQPSLYNTIIITSTQYDSNTIYFIQSLASLYNRIVCYIQHNAIINDNTQNYIDDIIYAINQLYIENTYTQSFIYNLLSYNMTYMCIEQSCNTLIQSLNNYNNTLYNIDTLITIQPIIAYNQYNTIQYTLNNNQVNNVLCINNNNVDGSDSSTLLVYNSINNINACKHNVLYNNTVYNNKNNSNILYTIIQSNILYYYLQYINCVNNNNNNQSIVYTLYQQQLLLQYNNKLITNIQRNCIVNNTYYGSFIQ